MTADKKRRRYYLLGILLALVGIGIGVLVLMKTGIEQGLPERPVFEDEQTSGHDHGHGGDHEGHDHD